MAANHEKSLFEAYQNIYANQEVLSEDLEDDYLEDLDEALTGSRLSRANVLKSRVDKELSKPGNKTNAALWTKKSQLDRVSRSSEGSFDPEETDSGLDFKGPRGRGGRGFKGGPKTVGASSSLDRPATNRSSQSVLKSIRRHDKKGKIVEDLDIYDLVLDHLLDEGYCDDEDSAAVIMANMSEEWRDEILEGASDQSDKQLDRAMKTTYKAQNAIDNQHQGRLGSKFDSLHPSERREKVKRMGGRLKTRRADVTTEKRKREDDQRASDLEFLKKYIKK